MSLNHCLQSALSVQMKAETKKEGESVFIEAHGSRFFCGDKVMQIRNNYDMTWQLISDPTAKGSGVFNGETGTVISVDVDEDYLEAAFEDERLIRYDRLNLEDLELAYAITIHKSQGSEYPVVALAIPPGAPQLLTRNLLYTAVTRARQKLLLIASRRTISLMLANNFAFTRYTLLKGWLQLHSGT